MKIMVFGTGAMGSIYAALFADAGHEVWAIDLWQEHIDRINTLGLRVEGASGDRTVRNIRASSKAEGAGGCDLYIIATKASGVGAAAKAIAPIMRIDSLVITIQNGLGAGERIAEHLPSSNILLGVAEGFGASIQGPGHVHHNAMKLIRLGEMSGGSSQRLEDIAEVWRGAGFDARAFADIQQLIWEKYLCNVTLSAPCTAFDCTLGELMADPELWNIALHCTKEAYALGKALGIRFSFEDPIAYVYAFAARMPKARPSMLLDHHARRPSEIDAINGMAVELGKKLDIPTPYNEALTAVVRQRERHFKNL